MNILMVHNYYQIPGGEDTVFHNEKELLLKHGFQVFLYTRKNTEINKFGCFRKIVLFFESIFSLKTFFDVRKIIRNENINIVHVHNTLSLISPSVYYAAKIEGVAVVQTIHNFRLLCPSGLLCRKGEICECCVPNHLWNAFKFRCYRNSLIQTLVGVCILKFHRLLGIYFHINYICLTEFTAKKLLELNYGKKNLIDPNKVYIKPNFTSPNKKDICKKNRKNQYAFVGRLTKSKGIYVLLEAWKSIPDDTLVLCGDGEEREGVSDYIERNQIGNIEMRGRQSHQEVFDILAESKALILPSIWYEGFPMAIVESYTVGTPVIASDLGNMREVVQNEKTGILFTAGSSEALINAIYCFDQYPEMYEYLQRNGSKLYSENANFKQLAEIYDTIRNKS